VANGPLRGAAVAVSLAALVVLLDQWTKALVQGELGPGGDRSVVPIVGDWLLLEYAQNRGVAFGAFGRWPTIAPVLAPLILFGVVVYALRRGLRGGWLTVGAGLVVGGAVGNLLDRVRLGYVIDFVAVGPWPNFNAADAAISVGVACLVVDALLRPDSPARVPTGGVADG
jgi:signal peptidase II